MSQVITLGNPFSGIQRSLLSIIDTLFEENIVVHYEKNNTYITKDGNHQSLDQCDSIRPFLTSCEKHSVDWIIHIAGEDDTYFRDKQNKYRYISKTNKGIQV
jgi:hypothetical protein